MRWKNNSLNWEKFLKKKQKFGIIEERSRLLVWREKMLKIFRKFVDKVSIYSLFSVIGISLVIVSAVILLWQGNSTSNQAIPASSAQVYFAGKYRIGDGDWKEIKKGEHISSTQGDVTLRGNFHTLTPSGKYIGVYKGKTPIAFYTDHISLTFYEEGRAPYVIDHENPLIGQSACGVDWTAHPFYSGGKPIEIVVHNPHNFGNEYAIDEMLSSTAFWGDIEFEKGILDSGARQRNVGLLILTVSLMFLGTALFSSLIHLKNSKYIWLLGLVVLFAGLYFIYGAPGVSFWSESIVTNTTLLGASMMLYTFFLSVLIALSFKKVKKVGVITCVGLGVANVVIFAISTITKTYFYDTWRYWAVIQSLANIVLIGCLVRELICTKGKEKSIYIGGILPLVAFCIDSVCTLLGLWEGGMISRYVFLILFVVAIVVVLRIIPKSINAVKKAKDLEAEKLVLKNELAENRISIMMSQIRPHFVYNTLGSIEQLCEIDPAKAGELVHNFSKYLRGNFGELDNAKPILISQEMEHVNYYMKIEKVRFPDIEFSYEMDTQDFYIPALTVQPIVENAVKHGLMKLSKGGEIKVKIYETDESYHILVQDNGTGFDTRESIDERKHVGIRNIRERLKVMVNGSLNIESIVGEGTKVLITVPKEVSQ